MHRCGKYEFADISIACTLVSARSENVGIHEGVSSHVSSLAEIAQLVEQRHGKAQVVGSIPTLGSRIKDNGILLTHRGFSGYFELVINRKGIDTKRP